MPRILGNIQDLITSVRHMEHSKENSIKEQAQEKAEKIKQDAREKAEKERKRILDDAKKRAAEIKQQREVEYTHEERKNYLEAREQLLEEVWQQAEDKLDTLEDDEEAYLEVLKNLALRGIRTLGSGKKILASDKRGHTLLSDTVLSSWLTSEEHNIPEEVELEAASEPADIRGGLLIWEEKSPRKIDLSFSTLLTIAREELRERIIRTLEQ